MIGITHNNLNGVAIEYMSIIKKWFYSDDCDMDNCNILSCNKDKCKMVKTIQEARTKEDSKSIINMIQFYHNNFDDLILIDSIEQFDTYINLFRNNFKNEIRIYNAKKKQKNDTSLGTFKEEMKSFYKDFFYADYKGSEKEYKGLTNGGWLAKKIGMNTCPYCNRQYTFTIKKEKKDGVGIKTIHPEFDHFYSKSTHPWLALSFYNLIPSCPTCNHTKHEAKIGINPYFEEFGDNCKFILNGIDLKEIKTKGVIDKKNIEVDFKFKFKDKNKDKNIAVFGLKELYNGHRDYVEEIIDKAQAYHLSYYEALKKSYTGLNKQPAEIDRFIWGNYLDTAEHSKRPLSKLTRDILEQIGINK